MGIFVGTFVSGTKRLISVAFGVGMVVAKKEGATLGALDSQMEGAMVALTAAGATKDPAPPATATADPTTIIFVAVTAVTAAVAASPAAVPCATAPAATCELCTAMACSVGPCLMMIVVMMMMMMRDPENRNVRKTVDFYKTNQKAHFIDHSSSRS